MGSIAICAYSEPSFGNAVHPGHQVASFDFPTRSAGMQPCGIVCIYCPKALKSASPLVSLPKVFDLAPNQQWLQLILSTTDQNAKFLEITLFVSFRALLDMVSSASTSADGPVVHFPWDSWAKHTAWMTFPHTIYARSACVYGSRAASITSDKNRRSCTLTILDLGPHEAKAPTQRSASLPVHPADDHLQSTFKGSRRPKVISSFNLNNAYFGRRDDEGVAGFHPVIMMDEDHGKLRVSIDPQSAQRFPFITVVIHTREPRSVQVTHLDLT